MSGLRSRSKGKRGELELAHWLAERGVAACRGQQHRGGADSPDVRCALPGVHLEVKRTERFSLYPALEQAVREAPEGAVPVVLHRMNRREWVAVLRAEDWLELELMRSRGGLPVAPRPKWLDETAADAVARFRKEST